MLAYAYNLGFGFPRTRILVPSELEGSRYDYVDTMRQGGREELQRALKEQFGLVARREMRGMDALVLTVQNPDATGLTKHADFQGGGGGGSRSSGGLSGNNVRLAILASQIGDLLGVTVLDQTGLAGGFDFKLSLPRNATPDDIKAAVLDQFGLALTPGTDQQQVEFLVAERVQ